MGDEPPLIIDADFEIISGPLPSTETAPKAQRRRYNIPRIIWQAYIMVAVIVLVVFIIALYASPRITDAEAQAYMLKHPLPVPPLRHR